MSERLPLFPLGTVLFPGLVLPLHIFEDRYRVLVRRLTSQGATPGEFGVVAIEHGRETEAAGDAVSLHTIGCTAAIRQVTEHPDGQFDLVTVGQRRFRVLRTDAEAEPYLMADVEWLPEPDAGTAEELVPGVLDRFQGYLELIRTDGQTAREQMPDDPNVLSYVIAATAILPLDERQRLLAADDARERLLAEHRMLHREMGLLRHIRALPVPMTEYAVTPSNN